jgi:hypothetical protein
MGDGRGARPGEAHHYAKLNDRLVREARRMRAAGALLREINEWLLVEEDVDICDNTLQLAVSRKTWKHVT